MIRISWSSLRVHEECRAKWRLGQAHGRPAYTNIRTFVHGNVVDRCQRFWLEEDDPQPGGMLALLPSVWEAYTTPKSAGGQADGVVKWRSGDDREKTYRFCEELLSRLEPILVEMVLPYEYQPSVRFTVEIDVPSVFGGEVTIELTGEIDLLGRFPDGRWWAMDLKGTANPDYIRKTLGQGVFYDIAIEVRHGARPAWFKFVQPMVEKAPIVTCEITDQNRAEMLGRIIRMVHHLQRRDFQAKAGSDGCAMCDVRAHCPKHPTRVDEAGNKRISFGDV